MVRKMNRLTKKDRNSVEYKLDISDLKSTIGIEIYDKLGQLEDIEEKNYYIELLNKIDTLDATSRSRVEEISNRNEGIIATSAISGEGCDKFLSLIDKRLSAIRQQTKLTIDNTNGALIAWIYRNSEVLSVTNNETNSTYNILIEPKDLSKLQKMINK